MSRWAKEHDLDKMFKGCCECSRCGKHPQKATMHQHPAFTFDEFEIRCGCGKSVLVRGTMDDAVLAWNEYHLPKIVERKLEGRWPPQLHSSPWPFRSTYL